MLTGFTVSENFPSLCLSIQSFIFRLSFCPSIHPFIYLSLLIYLSIHLPMFTPTFHCSSSYLTLSHPVSLCSIRLIPPLGYPSITCHSVRLIPSIGPSFHHVSFNPSYPIHRTIPPSPVIPSIYRLSIIHPSVDTEIKKQRRHPQSSNALRLSRPALEAPSR